MPRACSPWRLAMTDGQLRLHHGHQIPLSLKHRSAFAAEHARAPRDRPVRKQRRKNHRVRSLPGTLTTANGLGELNEFVMFISSRGRHGDYRALADQARNRPLATCNSVLLGVGVFVGLGVWTIRASGPPDESTGLTRSYPAKPGEGSNGSSSTPSPRTRSRCSSLVFQ